MKISMDVKMSDQIQISAVTDGIWLKLQFLVFLIIVSLLHSFSFMASCYVRVTTNFFFVRLTFLGIRLSPV